MGRSTESRSPRRSGSFPRSSLGMLGCSPNVSDRGLRDSPLRFFPTMRPGGGCGRFWKGCRGTGRRRRAIGAPRVPAEIPGLSILPAMDRAGIIHEENPAGLPFDGRNHTGGFQGSDGLEMVGRSQALDAGWVFNDAVVFEDQDAGPVMAGRHESQVEIFGEQGFLRRGCLKNTRRQGSTSGRSCEWKVNVRPWLDSRAFHWRLHSPHIRRTVAENGPCHF